VGRGAWFVKKQIVIGGTMEANLQVQIGQPQESAGCLSEVGWFFGAAILPLGSFTFYRKATQKSVGNAMAFFFVFTSVVACLITAGTTIALYSVSSEIRSAYERGDVPKVTITNGVAEADGTQPFVLLEGTADNGKNLLIAIDTSGVITEIEQPRYDQGFLLTRTELHFLSDGKYRIAPLSEVNAFFEKDPLYVNADTVTQAWGTFSIIFAVVALIGLWLWHFVLRLMIIAIYALVLWGIVALMRPGTGFAPILISGLYAIVPALYVAHLFTRSGFTFPGVQSFFLFIFWVIGLTASLMDHPLLKAERPLRGWTALIGAPMLLLFIVDMLKEIPAPYGAPALWAAFILTFIVHAGARAFFRFQESQPPPGTIPSL
jgi:hypothetical protein